MSSTLNGNKNLIFVCVCIQVSRRNQTEGKKKKGLLLLCLLTQVVSLWDRKTRLPLHFKNLLSCLFLFVDG